MPALARIVIILLTAFSGAAAPALNSEWLDRDREIARDLLRWETESGLAGGKWDRRSFGGGRSEQRDLGFGASSLFLQRPGGYSYAEAEIVTFSDRVVQYRLRTNIGSGADEKAVRDVIVAIWREAGNRELTIDDGDVSRTVAFPDVYADFREAVARELGPVAPHKAGRFAAGYADLMSPFEQFQVGRSCGDVALPPESRKVIERLVGANRRDLLENILRGYNPEGRVWAVIGLRVLARTGVALTPEIEQTIEKVLDLTIPITYCEGCFISTHPARNVVAQYGTH